MTTVRNRRNTCDVTSRTVDVFRTDEAYEQVVFSEKRKIDRPDTNDVVYFTEIAKYDDVMAATKKAKRRA